MGDVTPLQIVEDQHSPEICAAAAAAAEALLDAAEDGDITDFAIVYRSRNGETHSTAEFAERVALVGALELLKHQTLEAD